MRCDATLVVPREKIEDKPKPAAMPVSAAP
jgi:hypothetical protein